MFLIDIFQKNVSFVSERGLAMSKKSIFYTIFTSTRWVKPAWPAEPMFLTSTLPKKAPACNAGRAD